MTRALRSEWLGPRGFALLSALSLVAAIVYPLIGALWAFGPWLLAVAGFAWISHDMSNTVRRRHQTAHDQRRAWSDRVDVWALPPTRVSDDPDVALLAQILATPEVKT